MKVIFLDRDGVINKDIGYLHKISDFSFIDGIFETCKHFVELGYEIIVVTNQSGIARGYYSEKNFLSLTSWMLEVFSKKNAPITKVYYFPNHPDGKGRYKKLDNRRKPNPGMLTEAKIEFDLNLSESLMVGDNESDIEAGISAGVGTNILFTQNISNSHLRCKKVLKLIDVVNYL